MPLRDYSRLIHSPSLRWGTVFTISTHHADLHDLVEVSKITNLVALDITTPSLAQSTAGQDDDAPITHLTDRVVRSWSELALAGEAFKNLRVLMLHVQADISLRVFSYLDQFPSLEALIIVGFPQLADDSAKNVGRQHGWSTRRVNATNRTIYECYKAHITSANSADYSEGSMIRSLPLLEFSLGAPDVREYAKKQHQSVWFHRQIQKSNLELANSRKRTPDPDINGPARNDVKRLRGKPVPKGQKGINMAGLLAEFQRFYISLPSW
ncbi:conserved hypothetical protein [Histoplasma capsulatum G186AR]|uniref:Uncharacterized protein n=1 Tax=Ajellomyces capsulatus (strain G186AR / H82 / ATCC MYA-2454 / RMSCC 2432) TaxID=447093 RepID=C0NGF4_AJECG|nr:uncharacterized protein HCBG_02426 [Histoplasma capsulatum G186AR]EEH08889.1 conserved hypothetical protein [Histoplasma capsulatum G186AR]